MEGTPCDTQSPGGWMAGRPLVLHLWQHQAPLQQGPFPAQRALSALIPSFPLLPRAAPQSGVPGSWAGKTEG